MVVAEVAGSIAGFLQLIRGSDDRLIIDLIAVDEQCRGRRLAAAMIAFADQACLLHSTDMQVGTQISNFVSLAVYCNLGFRISSCDYVLHWHGAE